LLFVLLGYTAQTASNPESSCLSCPTAGIMGIHHHIQQKAIWF
jgi:hypothetical protein